MRREEKIDGSASASPSSAKRKRDAGPSPVSVGRTRLSGGPSMDTVEEALLQTEWKFRMNLLSQSREVDFIGRGLDWETIEDETLHGMRCRLNDRFYWVKPGKKKDDPPVDTAYQLIGNNTHLWPRVLGLCDQHRVNPLSDWLESCKAKAEGADESMLDEWLERMFDFPADFPEDVFRWVSRRLPCAMVARIIRPGTPWPRMVILYGRQGIGKSLLVRSMLPPGPEWDHYHMGELNFGMSVRDMGHAVAGKLVVECDEMRGTSKREIGDMRSFITRTVDGSGERWAYRRNPEGVSRTAVLIGTANHEDCIPPDPYGSRRYMAVPLIGRHDPDSAGGSAACGRLVADTMAEIRDTLYGLAYRALERDAKKTGQWGSMLLDDDGLTPVFREQAEAHQTVDELETKIQLFLSRWEENLAELGLHFTGQEVAEYCQLVKLETGTVRYESYAAKPTPLQSRVNKILRTERYGLEQAGRWMPGTEKKVWGWWHKESDRHLLADDYVPLTVDGRRKRLGIATPRELAMSKEMSAA